MTFHPDSLPDLSGKVYIVTGGTRGIGYYTVARLAQHGAHIYLCARSEAKGSKAVEDIQALYPGSNISVLSMDHTSLSSVVSAAKSFMSKETMLHGLVNNAGVIASSEMTSDGYELAWQTNYIAHWLFTEQLLPTMLETSKVCPAGGVRIVNITSGGQMMAPKTGINFADTALPGESDVTRYGQSKLANTLHARTLHSKYGPDLEGARIKSKDGEIWTSAIHPGLVRTKLNTSGADIAWYLKISTLLADSLGGVWPEDKGAWTSVFCVASPEMKAEQSGGYFERVAKNPVWFEPAQSKNMKLAAELEEWTRQEMAKKGWKQLDG